LAGALAVRGTLYPRFFFFLLGFALLMLTQGATAACEVVARRWGWSENLLRCTACAALAVVSIASAVPNFRAPKQDFQGAIAYVLAQKTDGAAVFTAGPPADLCCRRYYGHAWRSISDNSASRDASAAPGAWLVYAFPQYLQPGEAAWIRAEFEAARAFPGTLGGGEVYVCRKLPDRGAGRP
jgi:mannosyltransferase